MEVQRIRPGLWRWTTRHPEWAPDEGGEGGWDPEVGCVYWEATDTVVLIDPLVPAGDERERFFRALDRDVERARRPVAVFLTIFWHERSADEIRQRYGSTVWAPELALERIKIHVTNPFGASERLPGGVRAHHSSRRGEVTYWLPQPRALVAGDVLLGAAGGEVRVCPDSWLPEDLAPGEFRASLRPLLELPIELLLVSHGEPVLEEAREALERALR